MFAMGKRFVPSSVLPFDGDFTSSLPADYSASQNSCPAPLEGHKARPWLPPPMRLKEEAVKSPHGHLLTLNTAPSVVGMAQKERQSRWRQLAKYDP